jgi:hypothetical protein
VSRAADDPHTGPRVKYAGETMRVSVGWVVGASFLVIGGFFLATVPVVLRGSDGQLAIDAMCFGGPLLGGLLASLASRRRLIGEVGLGALLALALAVIASVLFERAGAIDATAEGGDFERLLRSAASFFVGSMAGAGLGHQLGSRIGGGRAIIAPSLWAVVAGFTSIGAFFLAAGLMAQVTSSTAAFGLAITGIGPSLGALIAWLMSPVDRRQAIALGSAAFPTALLLASAGDRAEIIIVFFMMWLSGWIGVAIGHWIRPAPGHPRTPMPEARLEE